MDVDLDLCVHTTSLLYSTHIVSWPASDLKCFNLIYLFSCIIYSHFLHNYFFFFSRSLMGLVHLCRIVREFRHKKVRTCRSHLRVQTPDPPYTSKRPQLSVHRRATSSCELQNKLPCNGAQTRTTSSFELHRLGFLYFD